MREDGLISFLFIIGHLKQDNNNDPDAQNINMLNTLIAIILSFNLAVLFLFINSSDFAHKYNEPNVQDDTIMTSIN